jgi:hypothetical protein
VLLYFGHDLRSLFLEKLSVRVVVLEGNVILLHDIVVEELG